jgi:hypothetical protein
MSAVLVRDAGVEGEVKVPDLKESAFNDPRFWVSVTAVLLTLSLFVFGFIATQLIAISAKLETANIVNTRQDERVKVLEDNNRDLRNDVAALEKANVDDAREDANYRFKIGNDLTEIKTHLKMKENQ